MSSLEAYDRAMDRLAARHAPFKVELPEGESGAWKVRRFEVKKDIEAMRCWRDGRPVPPGFYTRLEGPLGLFMTDTPAELEDARKLFARASGHVLITGLGLGMIPRALLFDRTGGGPTPVEKITIVELEADVITLVGPALADSRIEIVHANAFEWKPPAGTVFDWAWHDIWPEMGPGYRPEIAKMRRHYRKFMAAPNQQLVWAERWARD